VQFKLFKTIHCIKNDLTNSEKKCKIKWSKQELNLGSKPLIIDALTTTLSTLLNMSIKLYKNFTNLKIKKNLLLSRLRNNFVQATSILLINNI